MDKIIKLGVVGLIRGGFVASCAINYKNAVIRAICDKDKSLFEKTLKSYADKGADTENILCFTDYDEMLKSDIDAVIIANYAPEHVPFVVKALEAGKHVLSEIPAIFSIEQATTLKSAVKSHPELKYMLAENCCYWAFIQSWKKMYEDGKFGDIVYAESEYLHSEEPDKFEESKGEHWRKYFPAIRYITHNLGPLLYLMNDRVKTVSCMVPDVKYNPYKWSPENGVAIFKTEKGAVIRILISFGAYIGFDHNFRIIGTRGMVETDSTKPLEKAHSFAKLSDIPGSFAEKIEIPVALAFPGESTVGHGGADAKLVHSFIDSIINDTEPEIDVDMAIAMSLPGIIADESSKQGGVLLEIPEI